MHLSPRSDQLRCTTWLHPRTGEPVNSGHMIRSGGRQVDGWGARGARAWAAKFDLNFSRVSADLPRGWEEGFTEEGASYFIE